MASSGSRIRIGVIGLGRLWDARHKPALLRLSHQFQITAVCDQVGRRAEWEARQLGCAAVHGVSALIRREDVDAVYVLSPQWYGVYPLELLADAGKPVYCGWNVALDPNAFLPLAREFQSRGTPFMYELARRFYPVTLRLRELLATVLGPPRLIIGETRVSRFDRQASPGPGAPATLCSLGVDPGVFLLDWCRFLFQNAPTALQGYRASINLNPVPNDSPPQEPHPNPSPNPNPLADPDRNTRLWAWESITAEFPHGAQAHVVLIRQPRRAARDLLPAAGFQIHTDRGIAWIEPPDRLRWIVTDAPETSDAPKPQNAPTTKAKAAAAAAANLNNAIGVHEETFPAEPSVGQILNEHFHRLLRGDQNLAPGLDDAIHTCHMINALRAGLRTGQLIGIDPVTFAPVTLPDADRGVLPAPG